MIARLIPHAKAAAYAKRGWLILPLKDGLGRLSHHAEYCVCAVRPAKPPGSPPRGRQQAGRSGMAKNGKDRV